MRNITIDVLTFNERLRIGKQGENLTREITFDCAAWLDTLSGGVLSIVHQRPTDSDAYPCGDYTVTDTSLTWSINETDLAFSGLGRCELRYTIGSRIAKSKTFYTEIFTALNPLDTPPAAYEPYIDRVIDAARWEMDALSVGGTASETEQLSVRVDKIVPVDPDDGYGIYFRFGIPKGADGKGVSNATASVDNNTGTPSVTVTTTDTEEGMDIDFSFHNLKGATGAAGQDGDSVGTVTASVDNNTGTPSVTVTTSGGSGSPVGIDLAFHNLKGQSFDTSFLPSDTASGSVASFPDGAKNVAVDEFVTTIVPQQAGSGTPSPINPRAISGWTAANITHCGKNLCGSLIEQGAFDESGINTNSPSRARTIGFIPVKSGQKVTVSADSTVGVDNFTISGYPSDSYTVTRIQSSSWLSFGTLVTIDEGVKFIRVAFRKSNNSSFNASAVSNVMVEYTAQSAYEEYVGQPENIPFGQTVYGGSLNVTTGVLTIDKGYIASYNGETIAEPWISSMDEYVPGNTPTIGAQVVYPVTQTTVQLTPTEVDTFFGSNNIYSDCGEVSVKYRADIGLYIDKKLA